MLPPLLALMGTFSAPLFLFFPYRIYYRHLGATGRLPDPSLVTVMVEEVILKIDPRTDMCSPSEEAIVTMIGLTVHSSYDSGGPRHESGPRKTLGSGVWRDGQHVVGARNMRLEKELYGDPEDPSKQHTGLTFEKFNDIPVEATGLGVPEPAIAFTNPPLDPVLLENIGYARYTMPTPVQKYSIPIVAAGRDLMACALVRPICP